MAGNENRRRKKIEAKRSKRKEQQRAIVRVQSSGMVARMTAAQNWPLMDAYVMDGLGENGIGSVFVARRGPHGQVAGAIFLVDIYCLGVKDVITIVGSEWKWTERLQHQRDNGTRLEKISPEAARKLVEGSVEYARSLGIAPHRDWIHASPIFGDIDASQCLTEFEFGKDGKPLFVAGPYDTPERVQQIMNALAKSAGEGNYHFIAPMGGDQLYLDDDVDEFEDLEDTDDDAAITYERSQTDLRRGMNNAHPSC